MSNYKNFKQIGNTEKTSQGVVSLAIRPNIPSNYGEGSLSGKQLQERFDRLAWLIIDRYNEMAEALSTQAALDYIKIPKGESVETIADFIASITNENWDIIAHDPTGKAEGKIPLDEILSAFKYEIDLIGAILGGNISDESPTLDTIYVDKQSYIKDSTTIGEQFAGVNLKFSQIDVANQNRDKTIGEHTEAIKLYDAKLSGYDVKGTASEAVREHNASTAAHNDIRGAIKELQTVINNFFGSENSEETYKTLEAIAKIIGENKESIDDLLKNKISTDMIADNLETTAEGYVLSANQGYELAKKITEWDGNTTKAVKEKVEDAVETARVSGKFKGDQGVSISDIKKIRSQENVDFYEIYYADSSNPSATIAPTAFTVTNGLSVRSGRINDNNQIELTLSDGSTKVVVEGNVVGRGITGVTLDPTKEEIVGGRTVDTYLVGYTDTNDKDEIKVTNGKDGRGVSEITRITEDPDARNVTYQVEFTDGQNPFEYSIINGIDGLTPELQIDESRGYLQVRYKADDSFEDLAKVVGENGVTPQFMIEGTELLVSYNNWETQTSLAVVVGSNGGSVKYDGKADWIENEKRVGTTLKFIDGENQPVSVNVRDGINYVITEGDKSEILAGLEGIFDGNFEEKVREVLAKAGQGEDYVTTGSAYLVYDIRYGSHAICKGYDPNFNGDTVKIGNKVIGLWVTEVASGAFSDCDFIKTVETYEVPTGIESTNPDETPDTEGDDVPDTEVDDDPENIVSNDDIVVVESTEIVPIPLEYEEFIQKRFMTFRTSAFLGCDLLETVDLKFGVVSLEEGAFSFCNLLTTINLPSTLTYIREAFKGCPNISSITVDANNKNYYAVDNVLYQKDADGNPIKLIKYAPKKGEEYFEVPPTVREIAAYAFDNANNLTTVVLPGSVTKIENYAFCNCSQLGTIFLSCETIGDNAIYNCPNLSALVIGTQLKEVTEKAIVLENAKSCLEQIFYRGTTYSEWNKVVIRNSIIKSATIWYYSESEPVGAGLYWHFVSENGVERVEPWAEVIADYIVERNPTTNAWVVTGLTDEAKNKENLHLIIPPAHYGVPIEKIEREAFKNCSNIVELSVDCGIGSYIVNGCTNLEKVIIGYNVTSIDYGSLYGAKNLTTIEVLSSKFKNVNNYILTENNKLIFAPPTEQVEIPADTESIGRLVFENSEFSEITIPQSVKIISTSAFAHCSKLKVVKCYPTLQTIAYNSFYNCEVFSDVEFYGTRTEWESISGVTELEKSQKVTVHFASAPGTMLYQYDTRTDSYSVAAIGGLWDQEKLEIPEKFDDGIHGEKSVTAISPSAFIGTPIISVDAKFISTIGVNAFNGCTKLTKVILSDKITRISNGTFAECTSLVDVWYATVTGSSVTQKAGLPQSVESIGARAFYNCSELNSVTFSKKLTVIEKESFKGCVKLANVGNSLSNVELDVQGIFPSAFEGCHAIKEVSLGSSLEAIGKSAFEGCINLQTVYWGRRTDTGNIKVKVREIPEACFKDCKALETITFSTEYPIEKIGASAFRQCKKLQSFEAEFSNVVIRDYAFYSCDSLEKFNGTNEGVTNGFDDCKSIGNYSFAYCDSLTSNANGHLVLGGVIQRIGDFAFMGCGSLKNVKLNNTIEHMGDGVFVGCRSLQKAILPTFLSAVPAKTFMNCYALEEFKIPNVEGSNYTRIKEYAFADSAIKKIWIPKTVQYVDSYVFYKTSLTDYYYSGTRQEFKNSPKHSETGNDRLWEQNIWGYVVKVHMNQKWEGTE